MLTTSRTPSPAPSGRMTLSPSATPIRKFDEDYEYMVHAWYRSNGVHYPFRTPRRL